MAPLPQVSDELLPPPWGAGYLVDRDLEPTNSSRILFKVDSGCDPYDIISSDAVPPGTKTECFRTHLTLADGTTTVDSDHVAVITLRVMIGDRPRLLCLRPVIWPAERASHPLLIGQTTAMRTGLSLFVHDNAMRQLILGTHALSAVPHDDEHPSHIPPAIVASIGEQDDADLLERISPIDGYRAAMEPPTLTDDPMVNALMVDKELGPIFGPPAT